VDQRLGAVAGTAAGVGGAAFGFHPASCATSCGIMSRSFAARAHLRDWLESW